MILFPSLQKVLMINSSDWSPLCSERKVPKHTEWVYQVKSMWWYLGPSVHDGNYHRDLKSMITVRPEAFIWIQKNSPSYHINCVNSLSWQHAFSLGNVDFDPPTIRWVAWIFLKFFKWWIMSWYPRIFSYLSKKVHTVYHCSTKNI